VSLNWKGLAAALTAATTVMAAPSYAEGRVYDLAISRQTLDEALQELARQSGVQIGRFADRPGEQAFVGPLAGHYSMQQALSLLLADVGLTYRMVNDRTVAVVNATATQESVSVPQASVVEESDADGRLRGLEEVVVTAQKREERLQEVPLSISAYNTKQLERMGVEEFADYARMVPGLAFTNGGPGVQEFYIRGISSTAGNPTTQFYIDETPQSASNAGASQIRGADPRVFDMERLEVLRGPQGTLYGSSSMGGTIRVITNRPRADRFESKVESTVSTTASGGESLAFNGMLNLPLIEDRFALRLVGMYRDEGGFIDRNPRLATGSPQLPDPLGGEFTAAKQDQDEEEMRGGRITAKYDVTDRLDVTATVFWQDVLLKNQHTIDANRGGRLERGGLLDEPRRDEFTQSSLTINYDLGSAQLVSATSYLDRYVAERTDYSYLAARLGSTATAANERTNPFDVLTQEVRISSRGDSWFNYTFGAFYLKQDGGENQTVRAPGFTAQTGIPTTSDVLFDENTRSDEKQQAVFGQISARFLERFEAVVGARWFEAEVGYTSWKDGPLNGGHTVVSGTAKDSGMTPKVGLNFNIDDERMVFASASKGFRIGRPNLYVPPGPCGAELAAMGFASIPTSVDADSLWQYELGAKTEWLDDRLQVNAGVYYIDWQDIPQQIPLNCGFSIALNVGKASSRGAELELKTKLSERFEVGVVGSYTDAQLDKDAPDLGGHRGDRLQNVPEYMFAANAQYSFPILGDKEGYIRADYSYSGDSYQDFNFASNNFRRPSYQLANLRVGVSNEIWEAAIFVENVFHEVAIWNIVRYDTFEHSINRPRTVGLTLRRNW
jgi:outer membrane receptor protein involved in Fe transport